MSDQDFIPAATPVKTDSSPDFIPISATPPPLGENHPILHAIAQHIRGIQNSFDTNTATSPDEPLLQTGLKRVVGSLASPVVHPLDTAVGMANLGQMGPSNPLIQRAQEAREDANSSGGLPYAATKVAGDALGTFLGGKVLGAGSDAVRAVPERFGNPAPNYVPEAEQSVRATVKALNLPTGAVEPLVKDLMGPNDDGSTLGIIRHYAAKAGKPITGPLDAAKLAEKAGKDIFDHYESILKPIDSESVSVRSANSPIGFGEGQRATLRAVNDRITHINQQLDLARDAQARGNPSPLANQAELEAEARGLNQILYRTISAKTGIPESEIGNLRQSYGKLLSAGKTLTQAANAVKEASRTPPKSITEGMSRAMDAMHGGTEGVFNRRFRDTLTDVGEAEPKLPAAQSLPTNHAVPPAPIPATPTIVPVDAPPIPSPDMEAAAAARANVEANRSAAREAIAQSAELNRLRAQEEVLKMHSTEQAAQELSANRARQAQLVREGISRERLHKNLSAHPNIPARNLPQGHPLANGPIL